ncbi:MAG: SCO family protein [Saprospiraceae bacterium]
MIRLLHFFFVAGVLATAACNSPEQHTAHTLPIVGEVDVVDGDTIYHTIGDWAFYRQDSMLVTEDMLEGQGYIADIFFTSCPTICPRVTRNMARIQEALQEKTSLKLVSFTVDPKRDSVLWLRAYSENLGVDNVDDWWFLTGDKFELFGIADDYYSVAIENPDAPGGFDHSGRILFVDGKGQIRAFADGTDEEDVNHLIEDIASFYNVSLED